MQFRIRENAIVTQFYGLRHCCSLCCPASRRQLHLLSLCHSCCLSPPARLFRRLPTPTATCAGFPCVGLYAGVTSRGSGRLPVCSMQLLEHPGSAGVVERLKESLELRLGVPEGKVSAAVLTPRQPLNRHARGQPTAGHTKMQQACLSSCRSPAQLCRAAAQVSSTTRCQPLAKAPRQPRLPCSPGTSSAHVCRAPLARLQPLNSVGPDAARQNTDATAQKSARGPRFLERVQKEKMPRCCEPPRLRAPTRLPACVERRSIRATSSADFR